MLSDKYDIPIDRLNTVDQDNCISLEANDFNFVIDEQGFSSALQNYEELETLAQNSGQELVKLVNADEGSE